jgi:pimeloyl-ACP methyl ester carboxylesterase
MRPKPRLFILPQSYNMTSTAKPTIMFIHGSWHSPKHLQRVIDLLKSRGYPTSCPLQASAGNLPPIGMIEDAELMYSELDRLVNTDSKDVIVFAHSYGGIVATQGLTKELGEKVRKDQSKAGGIIRIVYMCAFIVPLGESLGSALGGGPPPNTKLPDFTPVDVCWKPKTPETLLKDPMLSAVNRMRDLCLCWIPNIGSIMTFHRTNRNIGLQSS